MNPKVKSEISAKQGVDAGGGFGYNRIRGISDILKTYIPYFDNIGYDYT